MLLANYSFDKLLFLNLFNYLILYSESQRIIFRSTGNGHHDRDMRKIREFLY